MTEQCMQKKFRSLYINRSRLLCRNFLWLFFFKENDTHMWRELNLSSQFHSIRYLANSISRKSVRRWMCGDQRQKIKKPIALKQE
ncbi:hypothetical protein CEXT_349811 [Caerostris extrusa]|uniref:Uncharacterized protein n=1 Tax=Caerostris extrusa TaxID=172846 RepID=A0AAV4U6C6_CAEEX|nr:hypothetical protein CEXT_349811 [Caerostris extrusa]